VPFCRRHCNAYFVLVSFRHLSKNFRRKLNRLERSALISMLHGYPDEECKNALVELFAEDPNDLGSPDYERRSRGWSRLKELFTGESASFHLTRFCLIGNVLLGILKHVSRKKNSSPVQQWVHWKLTQ